MPELPEVQTTATGLNRKISGLIIRDAWSDYDSAYFKGSNTIKDPAYFKKFRRDIIGRKVVSVSRRAKNILIRLSPEGTILIHMKMTGHVLCGTYRFDPTRKKDPWQPIKPESLKDPFNRHVHFLLTMSDGSHVALSDVRKFAKVTLIHGDDPHASEHLSEIGPEPLEKDFIFERFVERLRARPRGNIKQVLMDQSVIAGIGNIYADESLWRAGIHPLERVEDLLANKPRLPGKASLTKARALFQAIKQTLARGIDFGGDSTSDYRNVDGEKGKFHERHRAYQRTGEHCSRPGCEGTIRRIVLGGRGTHFCDTHQKLGH